MKQGSIIKAYKVLRKIGAELEIPWELKLAVANRRRLMQPTWDFQAEQEQAIVEGLQARYRKKAGETLSDGEINEMQAELNRRLDELKNLDVDITIEPYRIRMTDKLRKTMSKILTSNDMLDLDGFVEFEEVEGK